MMKTSMNPRNNTNLPQSAFNDETGQAINSKIEELSQDAGPLTQWRLRRARGREAVKYYEAGLREYMAARRNVLVQRIRLEEGLARKLNLKHSMDETKAVEMDIARIIGEAVVEFEDLISTHEKLALLNEVELIRETEELIASGKITERRGTQRIANIEASTDMIVGTSEATIRGLLTNLSQRFEEALANG